MNTRAKVARVCAGLYNHAKPQGMGFIHFRPGKLSAADALMLADGVIKDGSSFFDYLRGRVVKMEVRADGTTGDTYLYDRDNGDGAAGTAIADGLTDPDYADVDTALTSDSKEGTVP